MSIWNYRYSDEDFVDLNRSLARSKLQGTDWRVDIQETLKRHFLTKSSGMFKYRDIIFELWNFGDGWRGKIVVETGSEVPINAQMVVTSMSNNNGRNRWDYSKHSESDVFLRMINDLITAIDELSGHDKHTQDDNLDS